MTTGKTARVHARNARLEAQQVVGDRFDARVLEPSPPAVVDGEWLADDPVAVQDADRSRPVVTPVSTGDLSWDEWLGTRPEHASWAAARWLGAHRRLPAPPPALPETRRALHRLAVYVVSPARRRVNGKIGLRWTLGGFGTPFFGADEQVRVVGAELVRQRGAAAEAQAVTTLDATAAFGLDGPPDVGWIGELGVPAAGDLDDELAVDAAFDCLPADRRATFGASPGDAAVPEPYLYVLPWNVEGSPRALWNAESFRGAILPLGDLVAAPDQRAAALDFYHERHAALRA